MHKFFVKAEKPAVALKAAVLGWVIVCNVVVQLLHPQLDALGIPSWPMFGANILFFLMESEPFGVRIGKILGGTTLGLCAAAAGLTLFQALGGAGLSRFPAAMIEIIVVVSIIILGGAWLPYLCNSVAFLFFSFGAYNAANVRAHLLGYILAAALGNLIMNGVAILIIKAVRKAQAQKTI